MAEIYLATRRWSGGITKRFAVKRLLNRFVGVADLVQLFQDEAQLGSVLHHSNIVEVVDYGIDAAVPYMALEYVDGPNLTQVLRNTRQLDKRFGINAALFIAKEITGALEYAHNATDRRGRPLHVVHRDLSPNNVLVTPNGQVKVTDFGVARYQGRTTHTHPGSIRGTMAYIAPEQAIGREVDHRADLFSVGVLLYEMVTGMHPYCGVTDFELIQEMLEGSPPPPGDFREEVPEELSAITIRCLMPTPTDRYASAAMLRRDLTNLLASRQVADGNSLIRQEIVGLYADIGAPDARPWHHDETELESRSPLWTPVNTNPTQEATVDRGGPPQSALITQVNLSQAYATSPNGGARHPPGGARPQPGHHRRRMDWEPETGPGPKRRNSISRWGLTLVPIGLLVFLLAAGAGLAILGQKAATERLSRAGWAARGVTDVRETQPADAPSSTGSAPGSQTADSDAAGQLEVLLRSEPDNAMFLVNGTEVGNAPFLLRAPAGQLLQIVATKRCHRPATRWARVEEASDELVFVLQPDSRAPGCD